MRRAAVIIIALVTAAATSDAKPVRVRGAAPIVIRSLGHGVVSDVAITVTTSRKTMRVSLAMTLELQHPPDDVFAKVGPHEIRLRVPGRARVTGFAATVGKGTRTVGTFEVDAEARRRLIEYRRADQDAALIDYSYGNDEQRKYSLFASRLDVGMPARFEVELEMPFARELVIETKTAIAAAPLTIDGVASTVEFSGTYKPTRIALPKSSSQALAAHAGDVLDDNLALVVEPPRRTDNATLRDVRAQVRAKLRDLRACVKRKAWETWDLEIRFTVGTNGKANDDVTVTQEWGKKPTIAAEICLAVELRRMTFVAPAQPMAIEYRLFVP